MELMSIKQAAARGIERLRKPEWLNEFDHLKIDIIDAKPGPWTHLYCPMNVYINERDPIDILCIEAQMDYDAKWFIEYFGVASDSPEYKAEVEVWLNVFLAKEQLKEFKK